MLQKMESELWSSRLPAGWVPPHNGSHDTPPAAAKCDVRDHCRMQREPLVDGLCSRCECGPYPNDSWPTMSGRVEYKGSELSKVTAPSAEDCAAYCQDDDRCRFWTWNVLWECSLKSQVTAKTESDDGVISGVRIGLDMRVEKDRAYATEPGERKLQNIIYNDLWQCQLACIRDVSCTHFMQVIDPNLQVLPTCILKSGTVPTETTKTPYHWAGSVLDS